MSSLRYPQDWIRKKQQKEKISVVTCYEYLPAKWISRTGIDAILVGDSLGMVVQGHTSTLPVKVEEMIYHARLVRKGAPEKFMIVDMPFGSYQASIREGLKNAFRIIKDTFCNALKFEGADSQTLKIIEKLVKAGFPVMGHIGFTPQSYLNLGGFRIQGKEETAGKVLLEQAKALENAGCFAIVLELVEKHVAGEITEAVSVPTIGIGSGKNTDGQVLVLYDLLGMDPDFTPKHAKKYADFASSGIKALQEFDEEVKNRKFPEV